MDEETRGQLIVAARSAREEVIPMLDPNLIRRDMQPDEVLRAMLPVVRDAFARPWVAYGADPFGDDEERPRYDKWPIGLDSHATGDLVRADQMWAVVFASHVLPPLTAWLFDPINTAATDLDRSLTAFRDAWCDAAEKQTRETT